MLSQQRIRASQRGLLGWVGNELDNLDTGCVIAFGSSNCVLPPTCQDRVLHKQAALIPQGPPRQSPLMMQPLSTSSAPIRRPLFPSGRPRRVSKPISCWKCRGIHPCSSAWNRSVTLAGMFVDATVGESL